MKPGITMQSGRLPQVRRIDNVVYLRWGVNGAGIPTNAFTEVAQLPAGFYSGSSIYAAGVSNSATAPVNISITSAGVMRVQVGSTAGSYYLAADGTCWVMG